MENVYIITFFHIDCKESHTVFFDLWKALDYCAKYNGNFITNDFYY